MVSSVCQWFSMDKTLQLLCFPHFFIRLFPKSPVKTNIGIIKDNKHHSMLTISTKPFFSSILRATLTRLYPFLASTLLFLSWNNKMFHPNLCIVHILFQKPLTNSSSSTSRFFSPIQWHLLGHWYFAIAEDSFCHRSTNPLIVCIRIHVQQ